jgi:glucose/arabinose dehydrogenase
MNKHTFFRLFSALGLLLLICSIVGCQTQKTATTPATSTPSGSRPARVTVTPAATQTSSATPAPTTLPRPDHVVVVIEENHAYAEIIGSVAAPYLNALVGQRALFTNSHAVYRRECACPCYQQYLAIDALIGHV